MAYEELKVSKVIRWIIPEFNLKSDNGSRQQSNVTFLSYDQIVTSWCMALYPNGEKIDAKGHVGLFLHLVSSKSKEFLAKWSFTFQNENGIVVKRVPSSERRGQDFESGLGYSKFISHQELSKQFKDCCSVTIICELSIYGTKKQNEGKATETSPIHRDLKKMFEDELFCDLEIKANDGVTLRAHKTILFARSPVLMKMLTTNMKEAKTSTVIIKDFDSKTIKQLLQFIYCEEVEDFESNAKNLIYAAEKYELTELKDKCIEEISSKVTKENVIEAFFIADQISGAEKLMKVCVKIISISFRELSKDPKWKKLSKDMLQKLMTEILDTSYGCDV